MFIDTHSHIYDEAFDEDRAEVVARARQQGVERIVLPAIDAESDERLFDLSRTDSDYFVPLMGLHPTSVNDNENWRAELSRVRHYITTPPVGIERFYGIGEIGLDLYWSRDFLAEQVEAFRQQVELAIEFNLPIVVHTRDAWCEISNIINDYRNDHLRGIFHAFSADERTYEQLRTSGEFCFGIGGVVTFKKSKLAEVVKSMDIADIVIETDSPYLTPTPYRGTRNESAYVALVAQKIAELKEISLDKVAEQTTENAKRIFGL